MSSPRFASRASGSLTFLVGMALPLVACLQRRDDDTNPTEAECSECHGGLLAPPFEAAPPFNLSGETAHDARGNGAHEAHLTASKTARPVACNECHLVPTTLYERGHVDTQHPAEIRFSGPARAFEAQPRFIQKTASCAATFCHGGYFVGGRPSGGTVTEPIWTSQESAVTSCTGCHGMPPPSPHPDETTCSDCHENIEEDRSFSHPELHVNGVVNFYLPSD